mgnify:CR=1
MAAICRAPITAKERIVSSKPESLEVAEVRSVLGAEFESLLTTMHDVDTFPVFLFSDDRPRLVEVRSSCLDLINLWISERPVHAERIYAQLPEHYRTRSISESLLVAVTASAYTDLSIQLFDPPRRDARVFVAAPHLLPLLDESGLLRLDGLDARPWGLHTGDFAFQYHQLLRRGFGSGIHYGLIATLLRLSREHELTPRIALDDRRIRFKDEYQEFLEFDRWFGRDLQEDELDRLEVLGETFHGDANGGTTLLNPYAGLSVRWTADGPLKVVEIEEFMPPPAAGAEWVFARYLHAIRDTEKRVFVHCDGAVKAFEADQYPRDLSGFKHRGKGNRYRKLFRVDGEFSSSAWSELACSWFRGNDLISEYFSSEREP